MPDWRSGFWAYNNLIIFGALLESWAVGWHAGREPNLYFWRDRSGYEIDLLVDQGARPSPLR